MQLISGLHHALSEKLMIDKLKLVISLLLVAAGVAGFYLLADQPLVVQVLAFIGGIVAALVVMSTSPTGKQAFSYVGDSIAEAKRVVWPTRQETIQMTLVVFVMVLIMAAFLAVVDIGFAHMVQWIMGRGE